MAQLWHYCCHHSHAKIGESGLLLPACQLTDRATMWQSRYVWLTDLAVPIRDALGLMSHFVRCDRIEHRYRVLDDSMVVPWREVARTNPLGRALEAAEGARPRHWFVSSEPVPVVLDERA